MSVIWLPVYTIRLGALFKQASLKTNFVAILFYKVNKSAFFVGTYSIICCYQGNTVQVSAIITGIGGEVPCHFF